MEYTTSTQNGSTQKIFGGIPESLAGGLAPRDVDATTSTEETNVVDSATTSPASVIGRRTIRVVVADADFTVRAGIRALLEESQNLEVIGEARDTQELLRLMKEDTPDVVLLDYTLESADGAKTIQMLYRAQPEVRFVAMGRTMKSRAIRAAFEAGAVGFVARDDDLADLASIVQSTNAGETFVSRKIAQAMLEDYAQGADKDDQEPLTDRQKQLLALVAQGRSSREVSQTLGITVRTVHTHRSRIMKKLDIHTEAGLVYAALRMGLVSVD